MPRQAPYLQRRGDALFFRIAVPVDLRPHLGGREITKTLRTADKARAVPMALEYAARAKRTFSELRAVMSEQDNDKLMELVSRKRRQLELNELNDQHQDELLQQRVQHLRELNQVKVEAENEAMRRVMASFAPLGVVPPAFGVECAPAAPSAAPATVSAVPPVLAAVPTFNQVIDHFLDEYPKTKNPGMFSKHMTALSMLRDFIGNIPVTQLRQTHINDFFNLLQRLPPKWKDACRRQKVTIRGLAELEHKKTIGPKTFDDSYKASIRPFLEDAVVNWQDQGFPTTLTLKAIRYKGDREEGENKQRAFTATELCRLFQGKEMLGFAADRSQAHHFWLPHIGLFTGARVNEICQLNPQTDILQDTESGIWYFWITEETEGDERIDKSTKNKTSRRRVPIHPILQKLGLLDYVKEVKEEGAKLLFPTWKPTRGKASGAAEKWFRKLIVETGLRDETPGQRIVGMHAFRSTLLNRAMNANPPLDARSITGHAGDEGAIVRGYQGELSLENKNKILVAIPFDLDFK